MATIKNIGTATKSRAEARQVAKSIPNGKVVDMAQRFENPVVRWVALGDKVLTLKARAKPCQRIGKTVVTYKKRVAA